MGISRDVRGNFIEEVVLSYVLKNRVIGVLEVEVKNIVLSF